MYSSVFLEGQKCEILQLSVCIYLGTRLHLQIPVLTAHDDLLLIIACEVINTETLLSQFQCDDLARVIGQNTPNLRIIVSVKIKITSAFGRKSYINKKNESKP